MHCKERGLDKLSEVHRGGIDESKTEVLFCLFRSGELKMKKQKWKVKKFKNAELEKCGNITHKEGCYIKLREGKIENSIEQNVILDLNKKGEIVGIDLFTE